jgi:hypothetical protein
MTPLERAQARMREMREQGIVPERLNPVERAQRNPNSLRLAITAKCFECLGGQDAKNIRSEIRECTSDKCPLYPVRPYQ